MSDFVIDSVAALARARAAIGKRYVPQGMCLYHNDLWHLNGRSSTGPGAGRYAVAMDGWYYAAYKHVGDRNPPGGVPVYFGISPTRTDKNKAAGDVCISIGGGYVIATDAYGATVGVMTIAAREAETQRPYLGWTEDFLGYLTSAGLASRPKATLASATSTTVSEAAITTTPVGDIMNTFILRVTNGKNGYNSFLVNPDTMRCLHLSTPTQEAFWSHMGVPFKPASKAVQPTSVLTNFEQVAGKGPKV